MKTSDFVQMLLDAIEQAKYENCGFLKIYDFDDDAKQRNQVDYGYLLGSNDTLTNLTHLIKEYASK